MADHFLSSQEIRLLLVLSRHRTFTSAADELGITQSAVSRSILEVEERFGVELLSRGRNGSMPTVVLKKLLPKLRRAKHALDSISEELQKAEGLLQGNFGIAGFRSAATLLLPPVIATLLAHHPQMRIAISTVRETKGGVSQQVLEGKADFGITSVKPPRNLRSVHLGNDPYVLVRRKQESRKLSLQRERLILWEERCSDRVPEILRAQRWRPHQVMSVDSDTAVMGMLQHGAGFAIMPELATEPLPIGLERIGLPKEFKRDIWLCAPFSTWNSVIGRSITRHLVAGIRNALAERTTHHQSGEPWAVWPTL